MTPVEFASWQMYACVWVCVCVCVCVFACVYLYVSACTCERAINAFGLSLNEYSVIVCLCLCKRMCHRRFMIFALDSGKK